jgi:4-carboxymuconolactone decarboxylase
MEMENSIPSPVNAFESVRAVSPALARYTTDVVLGNSWKRPRLSARDRSIVTLSVLIARNQSAEMPFYLDLALDSGLKASEIAEIITQLAFYSGWSSVYFALPFVKDAFEKRSG